MAFAYIRKKIRKMNRYKALLKVVEVRSYTKAAKIFRYTQPALSQMISSLEKETSITFLYRSRYGIRLSPEGERLFPLIKKTVQQYEELHQLENEIIGLDSGIVRIGTVSSISCQWLLSIIQHFGRNILTYSLSYIRAIIQSCLWLNRD